MLKYGFVKLYRSLLDWEWYDDISTKTLFIHLILTVNISDSKWHGIEIKRGSRISSLDVLSKETGLTIRQLRTAIKHLETTGELTRIKYSNFTVFSVNNFNKFQGATMEMTNNGQSRDNDVTSDRQQNKNIKENKEEKKKNNMSGKPDCASLNQPKEYEKIISYLNQKADVNYKSSTKETQHLINARFAEGYEVDDFFTVIDKKCAEWLGTDMARFLRPTTLFSDKFESYLNQKTTSQKTGNNDGFDAEEYTCVINNFD